MSKEAPQEGGASPHRIPSLDGLRALSIFLVLALHTLQRYKINHHVPWVVAGIFNGSTGVYIFFTISGYLITSLLLREHEKSGSISLGSFYFRRALRILPPVYLYVGVLLLLGLAGRLVLYKLDILKALFFFHDYGVAKMWSLQHFWTLSIEEQFYFLWPFLLLFCLRRPGAEGRWKAAKVAIAIILLSPLIRVFSFTIARNTFLYNSYGLHTHADALMFGCVAALLQGHARFEHVYRLATRIWWIPPAVILVSAFLSARFQNYWDLPLGFTVCGAAIAFFLLWCVRNPASAVGRILNSRPIVHIGVLSYSIYIWQVLFLHGSNLTVFGSANLLCTFPFNWIAIWVVAELSYNLVEKPSLRLRNRITKQFDLYADNRRIRQACVSGSKV